MRKNHHLTLALALLALAAAAEGGTLVADFEHGETTEYIDGYPGRGGEGWEGPWEVNTGGDYGEGGIVEVNDHDPLRPGSGNYLAVEVSPGTRSHMLWRRIERPTEPERLLAYHIVRFDLRLDNLEAYDNHEGSGATAIRIFNADTASPNHAQHTWWIGAFTHANSGNWTARTANEAGSVVTIDTGIRPTQGVRYSFELHIYPETSDYRLILTDSTGNQWDSDIAHGARLRFRGAAPLQRAGDVIGLMVQKADVAATRDMTLIYSLDRVRLVREPPALLLLGAAPGSVAGELLAGILRDREAGGATARN